MTRIKNNKRILKFIATRMPKYILKDSIINQNRFRELIHNCGPKYIIKDGIKIRLKN